MLVDFTKVQQNFVLTLFCIVDKTTTDALVEIKEKSLVGDCTNNSSVCKRLNPVSL